MSVEDSQVDYYNSIIRSRLELVTHPKRKSSNGLINIEHGHKAREIKNKLNGHNPDH